MSGFEIIDFHSHFIDPSWDLPAPPAGGALRWGPIFARIRDEAALVAEIDSGDLAGRVVNTPTALFAPEAGPEVHARINDQLAALQGRHPGRIHALASIDVFAGEAAARELERAVGLGLVGAFVDSARGGRLLDAPEARPVLEAAARLGAPVFVHPVNPEPLTAQLAPYGRSGTLLARGTSNAATLVALLEGGALADLPGLRVVVTALAASGVLLPAAFGSEELRALLRRQVHVETMGFSPAILRALAETLGPANLLAGSDWPIVSDGPIRERAEEALRAAGLDAAERAGVGAGNARRLLRLPAAAEPLRPAGDRDRPAAGRGREPARSGPAAAPAATA